MKQVVRWGLNSLIIAYLTVIFFSGIPETNTLTARLKEKTTRIALLVGIWPSWSMFAPNPIKFDSKTYVSLVRQDGKIEEHDVEIPLSGPLAIFRKARWMKYAQDNLRSIKQRGLLGPAVKHFLWKYDDELNPITTIEIKRKWREIAPFHDEFIHPITATPRTPKEEILVSQRIRP
jgi:hypothetical protein